MVRRFLFQCLRLSLPILLVFGLVAWVDPYCLYHQGGPIPQALKQKNLYHSGRTMSFSNMLWKLIDLRRNPNGNILLGDSRLSYFDLDSLRSATGDDHYNLGIPGGNYTTLYHTFRYADSLATLRQVMVQVSFRGLHAEQRFDIYAEPAAILERPYSYVYNRRVLEAAGLNLWSWLFPNSVSYDVKDPDHWRVVLDGEREILGNWTTDTTIYQRLEEIAVRCKAEGARLVFVEYPTHPDVQQLVSEAGLTGQREAYLARLRSMATVIDLDRPGLFPADRTFWRDPLHLTVEAQRRLIGYIWPHP